MDQSLVTLVLLPVGLGVLGFIEPCAIGAHSIFLASQLENERQRKYAAFIVFVASRVLVMALFGAFVVVAGQGLIGLQTGMWLVFGAAYFAIGALLLAGWGGALRQRIRLAPVAWRRAQNPMVLGLAFGLSIPACAAPVVFALFGLAVTSGAIAKGAMMMALFAAALSLPLAPFLVWPAMESRLRALAGWMRGRRWLMGLALVALGLWSIYFGFFVDPADWSGA